MTAEPAGPAPGPQPARQPSPSVEDDGTLRALVAEYLTSDAAGVDSGEAEQDDFADYLRGLGVPIAELISAAKEDRVLTAAFSDYVHPEGQLTLGQVAALADMSTLEARRVFLALGVPIGAGDETTFTVEDAELLRVFTMAAKGLSPQLAMAVFRVVGTSFDRIADSAVGRYFAVMQPTIDETGMSPVEQARTMREAAEILCTGVRDLAPRLLAHHLWDATGRYWAARQGVDHYSTASLAVGFVDLVGFTPLSRNLSATELERLVARFESVAYDAVRANNGRVVKLIGDEVMFVALDGVAACEIALTLLSDFAESEGGVTPRGGVTLGEVLARDGDYYGPTVNLASRVGAIAVPNELLVTNPVNDHVAAMGDLFVVEQAGRRMLKGFDDPVEVFSVRRP